MLVQEVLIGGNRVKRLWQLLWPEKHPVIDKNHQWFAEFDRNRPIESYEFVSVDTELTGLNPRQDEIVSMGAVKIKNLRIVAGENFFCYVQATKPLPKDSTLVHRITSEQLRDAPKLKEVLPDFIEFCGDSLVVGHFVALDMSFINKAARKLLGGTMRNPCVDSMKLAQAYQERQKADFYDHMGLGVSYNLTHLSQRYKLPLFAKHDALEDAMQTAYLLLFLIRRLHSAGCRTLKDLYMAGRMSPF